MCVPRPIRCFLLAPRFITSMSFPSGLEEEPRKPGVFDQSIAAPSGPERTVPLTLDWFALVPGMAA